jgi:hypothetical protein
VLVVLAFTSLHLLIPLSFTGLFSLLFFTMTNKQRYAPAGVLEGEAMDEQGLMVKFKYQKSLKLTKEERSIIKKASVESLVAVVQELFAEKNMNALYRGRRIHPILFRSTLREQCGWAKTEIDDERMFELCPLWDDEMLDPSTPVLVSDRSSGSSGTAVVSGSSSDSSNSGTAVVSGSSSDSSNSGTAVVNGSSSDSSNSGTAVVSGSRSDRVEASGNEIGSDSENDSDESGDGGADDCIPLKLRLLENFRNFILPILETETIEKNYHTLLSSRKAPGQIDVVKSKQWKCRECGCNTTTWCVQCSIIYNLADQGRVITPVHEKCLSAHKASFEKRMITMEDDEETT